MLRLGYDAKRLFQNPTGLGSYSRELLAALGEAYPAHRYRLYSPRLGGGMETEVFRAGPPFEAVAGPRRGAGLWRRYGLAGQARRDRVALFHGLSHELPAGWGRTGIPGIVTMHDLIDYLHPEWYPWLDRWTYARKRRQALREAAMVLAVSASTRDDLGNALGVAPERMRVIYPPVGRRFYEAPGPPPAGLPATYWLYLGSVTPRKNLGLIVEALREQPVAERLPLVVAGRGGGYAREVAARAQQLGVAELLLWRPDLPNAQLPGLYAGAVGLIYPSRYEGFGLPVAECLACGRPVITTDRASLPEAGGAGALYVSPDAPEALASAMA
ncbi:MAG: glycosyltransferase family 1 protein, partial [Bacteroidetes bacterium]